MDDFYAYLLAFDMRVEVQQAFFSKPLLTLPFIIASRRMRITLVPPPTIRITTPRIMVQHDNKIDYHPVQMPLDLASFVVGKTIL